MKIVAKAPSTSKASEIRSVCEQICGRDNAKYVAKKSAMIAAQRAGKRKSTAKSALITPTTGRRKSNGIRKF